MSNSSPFLFQFLLLIYIFLSISLTSGTLLVLVNNCNETVWPGILGGAGHPTPRKGGFRLGLGEEVTVNVSDGWSGRVWGRQGCCFDKKGKGSCESGDCAGLLHCMGTGGSLPATVVEMTLGTPKSAVHYYDVSLVDGFNLPVSMMPAKGGGHGRHGGGLGVGGGCSVAACEADLNVFCPAMLQLRKGSKVVGCKSACTAAKLDRYCCTGEYASPKRCKPTLSAHLFKAYCPSAYSFAYDDSSSLHSCQAARYLITFCPPTK